MMSSAQGRRWFGLVGWAALSVAPAAPALESVVLGGEHYVADRVIVKLRGVASAKPEARRPEAVRQALILPEGTTIELNPYSRWERQAAGFGKPVADEPLNLERHLIVQLHGRLEIAAALAHLRALPEVEYAEADGVGSGGAIPTDPNYGQQWHHPRIGAPQAWDVTRGATNVIVAVVDSGVNRSAVDFSGRLLPGYDFVNRDDDPSDDEGHGTAVAGALGANANDGSLVAGIDWNCRILPVKVLDSANLGSYSDFAAGVDFAVSRGARVINFSIGGKTTSTTLANSVRAAIAQGVIFITITHNDGTGTIRFPGSMPESITVGATERNDARASFSNWGPRIDLVAPGRDIYTVGLDGRLDFWFGTSLAAPLVSGTASLLLSMRPSLRQEDVRALLHAAAADQVGDATDTPGFDVYYGWGRLDVAKTIALARSAVGNPPPAPRLVNVSTRAHVGTADNVLIGGFVVRGSGSKKVLIRALGPSLAAAGVQNVLADPLVEIVDAGGRQLAFNDNWQDAQAGEIGASGFAPANSKDAAVIVTLAPGAYTAVVRGVGGSTGVGSVEAYELSASDEPRFINLSTRGGVSTGDNVMIAGVVIAGTAPRRVLLRGVGPSLVNAGVPGALSGLSLELIQGGVSLLSNLQWAASPDRVAIQASGFAPSSPSDAAIIATLAPGVYTAIMRPVGTDGVGLVEVYDLE